jgi:hypothetical protein
VDELEAELLLAVSRLGQKQKQQLMALAESLSAD